MVFQSHFEVNFKHIINVVYWYAGNESWMKIVKTALLVIVLQRLSLASSHSLSGVTIGSQANKSWPVLIPQVIVKWAA